MRSDRLYRGWLVQRLWTDQTLHQPPKRSPLPTSPPSATGASHTPGVPPVPKKAPPFPTYVRWFCGACGEANPMKREHCNVCRGSQDDNRNVFQEGTHWICGVCGEENSVRRNACNSPYCKGVRLRDSVLTRYAPTEPGSSSSAGQEEGAPPKSSAGAKAGPPSGGPKPAYKEPPDTSCQSRPTGPAEARLQSPPKPG